MCYQVCELVRNEGFIYHHQWGMWLLALLKCVPFWFIFYVSFIHDISYFWCSYGTEGDGKNVSPNAALVFDVQLVKVHKWFCFIACDTIHILLWGWILISSAYSLPIIFLSWESLVSVNACYSCLIWLQDTLKRIVLIWVPFPLTIVMYKKFVSIFVYVQVYLSKWSQAHSQLALPLILWSPVTSSFELVYNYIKKIVNRINGWTI